MVLKTLYFFPFELSNQKTPAGLYELAFGAALLEEKWRWGPRGGDSPPHFFGNSTPEAQLHYSGGGWLLQAKITGGF